jgi:hypothetical protein
MPLELPSVPRLVLPSLFWICDTKPWWLRKADVNIESLVAGEAYARINDQQVVSILSIAGSDHNGYTVVHGILYCYNPGPR